MHFWIGINLVILICALRRKIENLDLEEEVFDEELEENKVENEAEKNEIIKKLEIIQRRLKGEYCSKKEDCMDDSNIICQNNKCTCLNGYQL
jgi:hypothetical protein